MATMTFLKHLEEFFFTYDDVSFSVITFYSACVQSACVQLYFTPLHASSKPSPELAKFFHLRKFEVLSVAVLHLRPHF